MEAPVRGAALGRWAGLGLEHDHELEHDMCNAREGA